MINRFLVIVVVAASALVFSACGLSEEVSRDNISSKESEGVTSIIDNARKNNLRTLDLSESHLDFVPERIFELINLKRLLLFMNQIEHIPSGIGALSNLEELDVSENQLNRLPPEIGALKNLRRLVLFRNRLRELPPEVGNLVKLIELDVTFNNLEYLPESIKQMKSLQVLSASWNQLEDIPDALYQLTSLERLGLSGNRLTNISPQIAQLKNLRYLGLVENNLFSLPDEIGDLDKLISLSLTAMEIPESIYKLKALECLSLYNVPLASSEEFIQAVSSMPNLQSITLRRCGIKTLPRDVEGFLALRELDLRFNELTELPDWLFELPELKRLILVGNRFSTEEMVRIYNRSSVGDVNVFFGLSYRIFYNNDGVVTRIELTPDSN